MGWCVHPFNYKEVVFSDVSGIQNDLLFCTFKYSIILEYTVVFSQNRTLANFRCKMAFFQRAWREEKILPRP